MIRMYTFYKFKKHGKLQSVSGFNCPLKILRNAEAKVVAQNASIPDIDFRSLSSSSPPGTAPFSSPSSSPLPTVSKHL